MFPVLHQLLGQALITPMVRTLLGADDKAGVAEIMTALAVLKGNLFPTATLKVAFTPVDERGREGAKHFDVENLARSGLIRSRRRRRRRGRRLGLKTSMPPR